MRTQNSAPTRGGLPGDRHLQTGVRTRQVVLMNMIIEIVFSALYVDDHYDATT